MNFSLSMIDVFSILFYCATFENCSYEFVETQIAELRATSIAKQQFDLAAERLKFEQEKEKAVKEAKSKQWCSNCQKSANYYCCWNTAYCDFECQVKSERNAYCLNLIF